MKTATTWFPKLTRRGVVLFLATYLLFLLLGWIAFQRSTPLSFWPSAGWADPGEQATPDCDVQVEPFPAEQRARHLKDLHVDRWHRAGHRGQGVKVAILDSGFRGYRAHLGKALPGTVTTKSFRQDGNLEAKDSQHGILCGEVIHAIAPEAELLLANWDTDSPEQFLEAVRWTRQQGANIVSCSIIMPSWSDGEGGGEINEAMNAILGAGDRTGDPLFFASAGNTAQRHWAGRYREGKKGLHEWKEGHSINTLSPWGTDRVSVELYSLPGADFELKVTDCAGHKVGHSAAHRGKDRTCHVVHFLPLPGANYRVQVRSPGGKGGNFHLVVLGGGLSCSTARGSIAFPADGPRVLAVGAVQSDRTRAGYSACGPNSSCPKPNFMAPVPFPSLWRDRPFTGTSAAAPQAAAMAALCWSSHPDWTASKVHAAMRRAARDLGAPGHDPETGHGLVHLPEDMLQDASASR